MNLPNLLTLSRIFFVPLLVAVLVADSPRLEFSGFEATKEFLALAIFLAAAATDLLDGYLARRWGKVTTVGTLLDPIADKLLISAALISLVQVRVVPGWMTIVIVGREFAISGLRSIAAAEGYTIKASDLGKTKMVAQVAATALLIASTHWERLRVIGMIALWAVMLFGVVSAIDYFLRFWRRVDDSVKLRRRREVLRMERRARLAERLARRAASQGVANSAGPLPPA